MPTSCRISPRRWRARSASRRPPTSIPSARRRRCSSRSTARPSTSPARASPTRSATFWTGVMMLEHLGEKAAAARLMRAVERVTGDPTLHTPDLGGNATTRAGHRRRLRSAPRRQRVTEDLLGDGCHETRLVVRSTGGAVPQAAGGGHRPAVGRRAGREEAEIAAGAVHQIDEARVVDACNRSLRVGTLA